MPSRKIYVVTVYYCNPEGGSRYAHVLGAYDDKEAAERFFRNTVYDEMNDPYFKEYWEGDYEEGSDCFEAMSKDGIDEGHEIYQIHEIKLEESKK